MDNYKFNFPKGNSLNTGKTLADILEDEQDVEPKYFASEYIQEKRMNSVNGKSVPNPAIWHENKSGNISPLDYSCALRAGASHSYLLVNGKRRLTPREQLRLQGFPETFNIVGTESQIRLQTGNSVSIPVVESVANQLIYSIENKIMAY